MSPISASEEAALIGAAGRYRVLSDRNGLAVANPYDQHAAANILRRVIANALDNPGAAPFEVIESCAGRREDFSDWCDSLEAHPFPVRASTDTREEILVCIYGAGGNGKGAMSNSVERILKDSVWCSEGRSERVRTVARNVAN